jgi:flagellar M-ring protein FliF
MAALDNAFQVIKLWPASKKIAIMAVLIMSIAGMFLLVPWIQQADYQVLYSNLSEADAAGIVQELREKKIPYQLNGSGTVLVAANEVYDLRLQLASKGMPQGGGVGFEIFDNASFTTSEFVQKLNYKRALEGELSRTIRSLAGVEQSRVHLVTPDKSVFAFQADKPQTSAAVFVTLKQGRKLNNKEVQGIVHLVSSSVEDLGPENITVVDNKGELLTKPSDDSTISISSSQMEYQHSIEKSLSSKIISILEPIAGRDKVKAKVSTQFDFTRSERTEEIFDPDGVVVRSEQKSTEKSSTGVTGGGVPGVASNLPGGEQGGTPRTQGLSQKQDEMINYETSKTVKRTIDSPVTLERLSVAIIIDGLLPTQLGSVKNPDQYTKRSEEDVRFFEDIVKKAIGFTEDRGDEISVTVMPFSRIEVQETAPAEKNYMPIVFTVLKYFVPVIVALLFFLIVVRPIINALTKGASQITQAQAAAVAVQQAEEDVEPLQTKEIPMEKRVIDWASSNPDQAAGLVKGWLEEK